MAWSTAWTGSWASLWPWFNPKMGSVNFFKIQMRPLAPFYPTNSSYEPSDKQQTSSMIKHGNGLRMLFPFLIQWEGHSPVYYTGFIINRGFKMATKTENHGLFFFFLGFRKCFGILLFSTPQESSLRAQFSLLCGRVWHTCLPYRIPELKAWGIS